jgi:hypothetical protein
MANNSAFIPICRSILLASGMLHEALADAGIPQRRAQDAGRSK